MSMNVNKYRPLEKRRCSFGKFRGRLYKDIPTNYLLWFYNNAYHQMVDRKQWTLEELKRRGVM